MRMSRTVPIAIGVSFVLLTGVAFATSTTCSTSTVCAEFINSSSGVAIHGEANTGIGIRGTSNGSTGFYGASRSGNILFPGVEGESLTNSGEDAAGAFGLTGVSGTPPAYGVVAIGSKDAVYGSAVGPGNGTTDPTTVGVFGLDMGGSATLDTNVAVFGESTNGTGLLGLANATTSYPGTYFGDTEIGVYADAEANKSNPNAIAVEALSATQAVDAFNKKSGGDVALATRANLIEGYEGNGMPFSVDNDGNVSAPSVTTSTGTFVRTTGSSGATRMSYSARTTMPVMEDFGEGQMVDGRGYVKLDPALSDVIDKRNVYQVFLTPEGDSKGLYVTQKSPGGFAVRESSGGRSTLAFSYRILAKPFGDDAQRLALAPTLPKSGSLRRHHSDGRPVTTQQSLDPFARLQSHLGPAAYAHALNAARKIETVP